MNIALEKITERNEELRTLHSEDVTNYLNEKNKIERTLSKSMLPYGDPMIARGDERDSITREKHREARKKAGWSDKPKIDQAFCSV